MRLISGRITERDIPVQRSSRKSAVNKVERQALPGQQADVVNLVAKENWRSTTSPAPSAMEADQALEQLRKDLPAMGQSVGDLHSNLDRSRILQLLAPLVQS